MYLETEKHFSKEFVCCRGQNGYQKLTELNEKLFNLLKLLDVTRAAVPKGTWAGAWDTKTSSSGVPHDAK